LSGAEFTLSLALAYIGSVTARHSSSGRQPNFAAWYKEWNYRTFSEGASATYIQQGGHHVGIIPHSSVLFIYFFQLWFCVVDKLAACQLLRAR